MHKQKTQVEIVTNIKNTSLCARYSSVL